MGTRVAPRVVVVRPGPGGGGGGWRGGGGGGGVDCGCCRCCTCLNLGFLRSSPGALKLAQLLCGFMCEMLLFNFGMASADRLGFALISFLNTVSGCGLVVWLLLVTYVFSESSCRLVRASLFEPLFNTVASLLYLSASSWVAWRVVRVLLPLYQTTVFFESYPAMTSAYTFGLVLGILHGVDAFMTYRNYKASSCR